MGEDEKKFVTQEEVNKYFKLWKETGEKLEKVVEKLDKSEAAKVELVTRVKALETKNNYVPPPEDERPLKEIYTEQNPPQTEAEWDELFTESPSYATDLRNKVKKSQDDYRTERDKAVQTLIEKHPDMYKRDEKGMLLRDKDGNVIFDKESPKGKIYSRIAGKDPKILESVTAPIIVMKAMELELKEGKEAQMKKDLEDKKNKDEKERKGKVDAAALATGGDNPPPVEEKIEIKYNSEEEKKHVLEAIRQGRYKDEKDYFRSLKQGQGKNIGYGRGGF